MGRHSFECLNLAWQRRVSGVRRKAGQACATLANRNGYLDEAGVMLVADFLEWAPEEERQELAGRLQGAMFCLIHVMEN